MNKFKILIPSAVGFPNVIVSGGVVIDNGNGFTSALLPTPRRQ